MTQATQNISVIICAYTEARWDNLVAAVKSVQQQSLPPREIIVVIDHNQRLLERVRAHIPDVVCVENREARGLSGARNSGVAVAQGAVIAFTDEDAVAAPDWLAQLCAGYGDVRVLGVGGIIEPVWQRGRPSWFPEEFDWVVGCTYRGMLQIITPVRNLIGCNMSFRREVFELGAGFRNGVGRVGTRPVGCEETEFCIRASQQWPHSVMLYEPKARVAHHVPASRASWSYFLSRCYAEGLSKALVARFVGTQAGLASERSYTFRTLPRGVARGIGDTLLRHDFTGLARATAIIFGLAFTTAGYGVGTLAEGLNTIRQWIRKNVPFIQGGTRVSVPEASSFKSVRMLQVEISQPVPHVPVFDMASGQSYQQAWSLVRLHTQPLGLVELTLSENGLTRTEYAHQIWQALSPEINQHLRQDGLPEAVTLTATGLATSYVPQCKRERIMRQAHAPFVSVVVATHDRTDSLAICLDALLVLAYPNYEIIVVDNAPSTSATADLIQQKYGHLAQIRYIREDYPGLAAAHNRALDEVRGSIVAFTDDDVIVDRQWLTELVQDFQVAENVACVTGMILPAELETPVQMWIEQYSGFSKGFVRRIFNLFEHQLQSPLYPYAAGIFGSGANMAFKTAILRQIGGFDPALGAGSKGVGGDDLAAFFEIITRGYTLVYQPSAILHHRHRRNYVDLRKQAYNYGVGLTAYLMKTVVDRPARLFDLICRIPYGLIYFFSPRSPKNNRKLTDYPTELTQIEWKGMLYGPVAYLYSRWHSRRLRRQLSSQSTATLFQSPAFLHEEVKDS